MFTVLVDKLKELETIKSGDFTYKLLYDNNNELLGLEINDSTTKDRVIWLTYEEDEGDYNIEVSPDLPKETHTGFWAILYNIGDFLSRYSVEYLAQDVSEIAETIYQEEYVDKYLEPKEDKEIEQELDLDLIGEDTKELMELLDEMVDKENEPEVENIVFKIEIDNKDLYGLVSNSEHEEDLISFTKAILEESHTNIDISKSEALIEVELKDIADILLEFNVNSLEDQYYIDFLNDLLSLGDTRYFFEMEGSKNGFVVTLFEDISGEDEDSKEKIFIPQSILDYREKVKSLTELGNYLLKEGRGDTKIHLKTINTLIKDQMELVDFIEEVFG